MRATQQVVRARPGGCNVGGARGAAGAPPWPGRGQRGRADAGGGHTAGGLLRGRRESTLNLFLHPRPMRLSTPLSTQPRIRGRRLRPSTHQDSGRHGGMQVESEERAREKQEARCAGGRPYGRASVLSLCLTSLLPPGRESSNSTVHTLPRHRPVLDSVHHSPTLMTFASARLPGGGPTPTTPRRLARRRAAALPPPRTAAAAAPPPPRAATVAAADEPVEAILFDMDGVLTLSEELSRECVFFERVRGCSNKKNSPSQPRASHVPSLTPLHPLPTHHSISIPPPESAPAS